MTDKDEIKFAIRYLKQGLKSKRTPPLYELLMKELGFVTKDKALRLAKEIVELKASNLSKQQLTTAKEIIKEFMRISTASVEEYEPEFTELIGKAEQFTKELDK